MALTVGWLWTWLRGRACGLHFPLCPSSVSSPPRGRREHWLVELWKTLGFCSQQPRGLSELQLIFCSWLALSLYLKPLDALSMAVSLPCTQRPPPIWSPQLLCFWFAFSRLNESADFPFLFRYRSCAQVRVSTLLLSILVLFATAP